MAEKIIKEQQHLLDNGIYFYSKSAKEKYTLWAKTNLELWKNVNKAIQDKDILEMLKLAKSLKVF